MLALLRCAVDLNLWRSAMSELKVILAIVLALKVGLLTPAALSAAPEPINQTPSLEKKAPERRALETPSSAATSAPVEPGPRAQESLTDPNIGRALEAFKPSESISADNAVPFPVNI